MTKNVNPPLAPVLYLPHGGGPLPLLGDKNHKSLVQFLESIPAKLGKPDAILIISAHWEEEQITITSGERPNIIYDYYGFPDAAYEIQYPAAGSSALAKTIAELFQTQNIEVTLDNDRGFDHGLYVPLKLMYPQANIPCVQISLLKNLNSEDHIAMGKALAALRQQNVLIIGSGLSFHNMSALRSQDGEDTASQAFNDWLIEVCTSNGLSLTEKEYLLSDWAQAPSARYCHPREEHLLPLHVCFGAGSISTPNATVVFNELFLGKNVSAFLWE